MNHLSAEDFTLQEKIHLVAGHSFWRVGGVERLGLPAMKTTDASNGVREQYEDASSSAKTGNIPAVCYPSLCGCGSSFDAETVYEQGRALGEECRARGIAVLLGPGMNLKRNPLCGRNFEYFSEDPLLSGKLGAAFIRGVQSTQVAACPKHFAANSQETRRMKSNSVVDAKTLFELYLRGFGIAVKEGKPWVIMGAYNKLNGIYCCENEWLLNDVLRETWGYDGTVISDWGGVYDMVRAVNAGLDVEMPGAVNGDEEALLASAEEGKLKEAALNRAAENLIRLAERTEPAWAGGKQKHAEADGRQKKDERLAAHLDVARRMAESSFVLLKNDRDLLPLKKEENILVVGTFAKRPRYQGSGSSRVKMAHAETPWMMLREEFPNSTYEPGYDPDEEKNAVCFENAVAAARGADKVVVFAGLPDSYESEGFDRDHMKLPPEQNHLIKALCRERGDLIVVLQCGAPVEMLWKEETGAILVCYLGGSALGSALTNVLSGRVNPSGRLAESWPERLSDLRSYEIYPAVSEDAVYAEKNEVGYRYYQKSSVKPAYPFGYGLSYTSFAYHDLSADLADGMIAVSCHVENTGGARGREVVQIYLQDAAGKQDRRLAAFAKIPLDPGETKEVRLRIDPEQIALYDGKTGAMVLPAGEYRISAGKNSAEMHAETALALTRELSFPIAAQQPEARRRHRRVPSETDPARITPNSSLRDLSRYRILRPVIRAARMRGEKMNGWILAAEKLPDLLLDSPLRQLPLVTNGKIRASHIEKVCTILNRLLQNKKRKKSS